MNQQTNMALPAGLANRQRRSLMDDMSTGLGAQRPAHISIAGGKFHIVDRIGNKHLVPTHHLDMIIVDVNPTTSRLMYDPSKPFDPGSTDPPICWSDNGTGPSKDSLEPQAPTCAVCQWNMRGSDTTFSGKPTTACDKRKKFGVIFPNQPDVEVYEFTIPPGSLGNMKAYSDWLRQQATGGDRTLDVADMITRVEWDPKRPFVMTFQAVGWADDASTVQMIEYIDANHLSDVAVNRHDVAMDPGVITQLLASRGQAPGLAAPVAPQAPVQHMLPPRTQGPAAAPAFQPAPVYAPAPQFSQGQTPPRPTSGKGSRGPRAPKEPAPAPQQAPFMPAPQQFQPAPQGIPPIPAFLQRAGAPDTRLQESAGFNPAPNNGGGFGMASPGAPPAGVASALDAAMNLPPRPRP